MKKSLFKIAILLSFFSVIMTSCSEDEKASALTDAMNGEQSSLETEGTYSLIMDGKTVASGTTEEIGIVNDLASIAEGEAISIIVSSIPLTVGEVSKFEAATSSGTVMITGQNLLLSDDSDEMYFSASGSVTRESKSKISFEGTCKGMLDPTEHTFSGYIESDAYKTIE